MVVDMDTQLQHLISISIDKISSETCGGSAGGPGRPGRKAHAMDLRKALLVAHLIQEVRCAYLDDSYHPVGADLRVHKRSKSSATSESPCNNGDDESEEIIVKDEDERFSEESRMLLNERKSSPSPTVLQSCQSRRGHVTVSRISQVTRPLAVSVNTNHVMSCDVTPPHHDVIASSSSTEVENEEVVEELEVSSCCEVVSTPPEVVTSSDDQPEAAATSDVDMTSSSSSHDNDRVTDICEVSSHTRPQQQTGDACRHDDVIVTSQRHVVTTSSGCPLPKKKRPLPREFLQEIENLDLKRTKSNDDVTNTTSSSSFVTSSSVMTSSVVCSTIGTSSYCTSVTTTSSTAHRSPKVVVQMTSSRDYLTSSRDYVVTPPLPFAPYTQRLYLGGIAHSFPRSAMV